MLEGIADLIYREDDGSLVIVDYKTDAVPGPAHRRARGRLPTADRGVRGDAGGGGRGQAEHAAAVPAPGGKRGTRGLSGARTPDPGQSSDAEGPARH